MQSKRLVPLLVAALFALAVSLCALPLLAFAQDDAAGSDLAPGSVNADTSVQTLSVTDYTYEVTPLLPPFNKFIFVKTDNPDPTSFRIGDTSTRLIDLSSYLYNTISFVPLDTKFFDVPYEDESTLRVAGGYIFYDRLGYSDGGELVIQVPDARTPTYFVNTTTTVQCQNLVDAETYLMNTYGATVTGPLEGDAFFAKLDAVQVGLSALAVYPRTLVDDQPENMVQYPSWISSYYPELSLVEKYGVYEASEGGLLTASVYPFVLDSLGFPNMMRNVAERLSPNCEITLSPDQHSQINVTLDGTTKAYGGAGSGSQGDIFKSKATVDFFTSTPLSSPIAGSLDTLRTRYLKYQTDTDADLTGWEDALSGNGFTTAIGGGCWMRIGVELSDECGYAYAAKGPTVSDGPVFVSDAWVDGRYINDHERYVPGERFSDHPTADIVITNMTFTDSQSRQRTSAVVFQYDSSNNCWTAGDYYSSSSSWSGSPSDLPDAFVLTPAEVAAMQVDGNTDLIPDSGRVYDGSEYPGTPFTNTHVQAIALPATFDLANGSDADIPLTFTPSNPTDQKVYWSSSNTDIVNVNNGHAVARGLGTATVTARTRDGRKTATCLVSVVPTTDIANATVEKVADQVWTGQPIHPEPVVKMGTKTLVKDTDYTLSYTNSTKIGEATITVTGAGNYGGNTTTTFNIVGIPIDDAVVTTEPRTYVGYGVGTTVTVTLGTKVLSGKTDYSITSYENNENVGTATVVVTGKGNYAGTAQGKYRINPANLVSVELKNPYQLYYADGSPKKAEVVVTGVNRAVLREGVDYDLSYSPCVSPGSVTVTATGKGNYTGAKTVSYTIRENPSSGQQGQSGSGGGSNSGSGASGNAGGNAGSNTGGNSGAGGGSNGGSGSSSGQTPASGGSSGGSGGSSASNPADSGSSSGGNGGSGSGASPSEPVTATQSMHRLYNPNSGEHFYTADENERAYLMDIGWQYEGVGWNAPATSSRPVYRLYNRGAGDHHYTPDAGERDYLIDVGWEDEGIGWYSADETGAPLYRQYNPNAKGAGSHNYTADTNERDFLVDNGWNDEGIGWYGMR